LKSGDIMKCEKVDHNIKATLVKKNIIGVSPVMKELDLIEVNWILVDSAFLNKLGLS
jgi:hypothetical protein